MSLKISSAALLKPVAILAAMSLTWNVSAQTTNYWTGSTSTAWNNPLNWTGNVLPTSTNTATVNDTSFLATLSVNSAFSPSALMVGDGVAGTLYLTGGALVVTNDVGIGWNGGFGTVNMSAGTFTQAGGAGSEFDIGNVAGSTAVWNMTNGTLTTLVTTRIANEGSQGTFNMYAGSVNASNYLSIGRDALGILNQYGGTITKSVTPGTTVVVGGGGSGTGSGTVNLYGGTLNAAGSAVQVAFGTGGAVGTLNLVGGQLLASLVSVDGGNGTINLYTNATLTVGTAVQLTGGSGTFNFNGGTLQASASSANFITNLTAAYVLAGGAVIDTTNNAVSINESLLDGDGLGGGLTKLGTGALYLNGANTYSGATMVNAGLLGGNGSILGTMTVKTNAGVAPGYSLSVGTLTVGGLLTLTNNTTNSFKFNSFTNDLLVASGGLAIGSTKFNLFGEGTGIPYSAVGTYNLIQYGGSAPVLDSTWTTASATNPHVANPSYGFIYQFSASGGYLTLAITSTLDIGSWGVNSDGNWSVAGNWTGLAGTMPPRNASDSAIFGTGTSLRTVTLDANETVGAVTMNNSNSFVVTGGKALTLDRSGTGATIGVTDGSSNAIQTALALNDNIFVTVNSGKSLSLSGTITNSAAAKTISVNGAGTLAISGNNSYGPLAGSAGTILSGGGTLQLGNNNALGAADVTNSGTYTIQSAAAGVSVTNRFNLGATLLAGNDGANNLTLGGMISGGGSFTKVGNDTVTLGASNVYAGFTTVSAGTLNVAAGAVLSPATASSIFVGSVSNIPAIMTNSGTINVNASVNAFNVGSGADLVGTFNMGGGLFTENTAVRIGSEPSTGGINPGSGTFNLSGGTVTSLSYWQIGRNFGTGLMNMTGGTFIKGSVNYFVVANSGANGTFNMSGGSLIATGQVLVAFANGVSGSVGLWNLGGTANVTCLGATRFAIGIGGNGTLSQTGGTFIYSNTAAAEIGVLSTFAGTGLWNMSGGVAGLTNRLFIGDGAGSAGTLTLSGPAAMSVAGIQLGVSTGSGTLNLNGGTLTVNGTITNGTGTGSFNFNGGSLKAGVSSPLFMTNVTAATILPGGANIDTGTNSITIAQPLLDGGGGFLTKQGSGTLVLSSPNTYNGSTTVSNGLLEVDGSLSSSSAVTIIASGTLTGNGLVGGATVVNGTIEPGTPSTIGLLTCSSSVMLKGTTVMKLNKTGLTNDVLSVAGGLAYGGTLSLTNLSGTLTASDTFKLFSTPGSGAFTNIMPAIPAVGLAWNTNTLAVDGILRLTASSAPLSGLKFTANPVISGTGLTISATNTGAGTVYLLTTTNLLTSIYAWTPVWTNVLTGSGSFTTNVLNAVNPALIQQFYLLSNTNN